MNSAIIKKISILSLAALLLLCGAGGVAWRQCHRVLANQVEMQAATAALRNQMEADMMHDALRADVAMTRRAFDLGADVRRVIEPDVRLRRIAEHALPCEVTALLSHLRDLTDAGAIGGNVSMAAHTSPHARKASHRPLGYGLVAVLRARDLTTNVNVVRELERLLDFDRMTAKKVIERSCKRWTRRRKDVSSLPGKQLRCRRIGHVSLEDTAAESTREGGDQDQAETCEPGTDDGNPHRDVTSPQQPA